MTPRGRSGTAAPAGRVLAAARLWASSQMPYLASALFAAPLVFVEGSATVAVDRRWRVQVDPAVLVDLEVDEVGRLLLHLVAHLLREHDGRAPLAGVATEEGADRWNRAADAEINDDLRPSGLVPRVAPDLPSTFGLDDAGLAEHYWPTVPGGRRWDCGSGCDGRPRPGEEDPMRGATRRSGSDGTDGLGERQAALLRLSVAAAVQQAAGREPGTVPAGWLRWAETVLPSRVDWRRLLAAEVRREVAAVAGAVDYSYRRPSRRADAVRPVLLPALERPVPSVAIVCDTSGSMHDHLLERALAEVETILARAGVRQGGARVLAVDTTVHAVRRVTAARQVVLAGGGGTDMGAGIAAAAALRPPPSVAIVLTDGYTPWPADGPKGMRVVVGLLTQSGTPPPARPPAWARVVVIEEGFDR